MITVLLACRDLMTASRLEAAAGLDVRRLSNIERVWDAIDEHHDAPDTVVVVDLDAFPDLPAQVRGLGGMRAALPIIAFAPHVQAPILDEARAHADLVIPRGSAVKALERHVERVLHERRDTQPVQER